jgi:hypothetical protein
MAERGRTSPLDSEVQAAIAAGTAYSLILGGAIDRVPGEATAEFEIVGTDSMSLVEGGDWVAEKVVALYPWDAGTDSGPTYAAPDQASQPRQAIHLLEGHPVALGGAVAPFGTFTFRRTN